MPWDNNSDTCTAVFGTLIETDQIENTLTKDETKILKMQELEFYDNLASDAINNAKALALAKAMDSEFTGTCFGNYKASYTMAKAVKSINAVLMLKDDTVEQLADAVDLIYVFP